MIRKTELAFGEDSVRIDAKNGDGVAVGEVVAERLRVIHERLRAISDEALHQRVDLLAILAFQLAPEKGKAFAQIEFGSW